jgi:hypothetical protein
MCVLDWLLGDNILTILPPLAAEFRNDPRNPYAAELAKSSLH